MGRYIRFIPGMREYFGHIFRLVTGIGLIALIFFLTDIDLKQVIRVYGKVDFLTLSVLLVPLLLAGRVLMSVKWNLLLRAAGIHISLWQNLRIYFISGFVGLVLPASVGVDATRTYQLASRGFSTADVVASIVVERLIGFLVVVLMVLVTLPVLVLMYPELASVALPSFLVIASSAVLMFGLLHRNTSKRLKPLVSRLAGKRVSRNIGKFVQALHAYKGRRRALIVFFFLTLLESSVPILVNVIIAWALGIAVPWYTVALIIPITLLVLRVPVSISGIGVTEWSYIVLYTLVGMTSAEAVSLGILADGAAIASLLPGAFLILGSFFNAKNDAALKTVYRRTHQDPRTKEHRTSPGNA